MVTALALVLVTVMVCATLVVPLNALNVRLVLLREIGAVGAVPDSFDVSFTTSGTALGALSVMMMAPSSAADVGVTVTVTMQLPVLTARGVVKQVPVVIV